MAETPELTKLLEDLKREVIESRNMTIKTDNALKTLQAELKQVSGLQNAFQKRTWFATGAAYVLFVALCVAGVIGIGNARSASGVAERERLEKQLGEVQAAVERLKGEASAQAAAEQAALAVYKQMTTLPGDERLKGLDALAKLDQSRLSPFARLALHDRATLLRKEVGQGILEKGRAAFRRQDFAEAAGHLTRFLALEPPEEDALEASFFLGNSLFQVKKYEESIKPLARFVETDRHAKVRDFAMLMLMQSYEMVGRKDESLAVAREALGLYPGSDFRGQFQVRLQRGGGTPAAAAPAVAPAGAAAAPPRGAPAPGPAAPVDAGGHPGAAAKPGTPVYTPIFAPGQQPR
jgi:TolA-binding protein